MKYALIIGNNKYDDQKLAQLKTPAADSQALAKVLGDKTIGSFDEVTPLINQTETMARRTISSFLSNRKPDDLVLLYFSGHGVLDDRGRLYLALRDTQVNLLKATSIPSSFVADEMDSCRSKRQILVLDCCHSGAFARGTKGEQKAITETTFEGSGFGRVVLTASDSTQYALEGDQVIKQTELSLFTHFLLEGLKTGEADINNDGHISLDEWYDYTYGRVISETPRQVPHKWSYNQQGDLIIARNPYVKKKVVELPHELHQALESSFVGIRESAVSELSKYLRSRDPEMVELAIASLEKMRGDDSRRISSLAERLLTEFEQARTPVTKHETPLPKPIVEPEPETAKASSDDSLATPKMAAGIEPAVAIRTSQPYVEESSMPVDRPAASQNLVSGIPYWFKWFGITILAVAILNMFDDYLYDYNELVKSVPILFGILAGLAGVTQWFVFRNQLGRWWIAANAAAGIVLGLLNTFLSYNYERWFKDELFRVWVIGNLALGSILMWKAPEKSNNDSLMPFNNKSMVEFLETRARESIFSLPLSIYLVSAALLGSIAVFYETGFLSISESLKNTVIILNGIAGIFVGVSFITKKEMLRIFGFSTLAVFLLLDGIATVLDVFISDDYPAVLFALLGIISLASGLFFISQREIWKDKNIGFVMMSCFLISTGLAYLNVTNSDLLHPFLLISSIFAFSSAGFFFLRKQYFE